MTTVGKAIIGVALVLMLAGVATQAQGQVVMRGSSFVGEARGPVQIKGTVICSDCSPGEAYEIQPQRNKLYQLTHRQGQVMMNVSWVNNFQGWSHFAPPLIWVRGEDSLFQKLTAKENLFKEVEVSGILSHTRTLDVSEVTIRERIDSKPVLAFENVHAGLLGTDPERLHQELLNWQQEQPDWPQM